LKKSRRKAAFAVADAAPKKCFGEPPRQQMGFDESLPARKSRRSRKVADFSDKIMLKIKGFRALADST
jgi:hypothetical protein